MNALWNHMKIILAYSILLAITILSGQKDLFSQKLDDHSRIQLLNDSIERGYVNDTIYFLRGISYLRTGDLANALSDAKLAIKITPNNIWNYVLAGDVFSSMNDLDSAQTYYNNALSIDSTVLSIHKKKIDLYMDNNHYYLAFEAIKNGMHNSYSSFNVRVHEDRWVNTFISPLDSVYKYFKGSFKSDSIDSDILWKYINISMFYKGLVESKPLILKYRNYNIGLSSYQQEASKLLGKIFLIENNSYTAGYLFSEYYLLNDEYPGELKLVLYQYNEFFIDSLSREVKPFTP